MGKITKTTFFGVSNSIYMYIVNHIKYIFIYVVKKYLQKEALPEIFLKYVFSLANLFD